MPASTYMHPLTLGVKYVTEDVCQGIYVAFETALEHTEDECGILLFDRESGECLKRHVFPPQNKVGNVRYDFVKDVPLQNISYLFFEGETLKTDSRADAYVVDGKYGMKKAADDYKAVLDQHKYDWEETTRPKLPYADSLIYCLHVRGFTKHSSSGVIAGGTFQGLVEKLPYLKDLGITTLELQPCYEFDELDKVGGWSREEQYRLNYWGYKNAYFYAPKSLYCFTEDPVKEFKDMVKAYHKAGMEVIMQFYFPEQISHAEITNILRHWAYHYQIDGFHLMGANLPLEELLKDPYLAQVKMMHHYLPMDGASAEGKQHALYDDKFMYVMRRFLKSDSKMLGEAMECMKRNPKSTGVINYFSNYNTMTMMDMVSYNRKHNESNGECNQDGSDYNFTWNCGEEGESKKRNVLKLRNKQIHNAFAMLMLSQGTPLLFMGDEFGNSQSGNNNPYCHDDEITWLDWNDRIRNKELFNFVKSVIAFRRANKVFHQEKKCTMTDYKYTGYPDLSYHNQVAWVPKIGDESRHIAMMLCGDYAEGNEGQLWYVAFNMHWEAQEFALPKLPIGHSWEKCLTTESTEGILTYGDAGTRDKTVIVAPRSIAVYCSS